VDATAGSSTAAAPTEPSLAADTSTGPSVLLIAAGAARVLAPAAGGFWVSGRLGRRRSAPPSG
jgi:hypothetical protein